MCKPASWVTSMGWGEGIIIVKIDMFLSQPATNPVLVVPYELLGSFLRMTTWIPCLCHSRQGTTPATYATFLFGFLLILKSLC